MLLHERAQETVSPGASRAAALAVGALAVGAVALGALAVGFLAIRRLAVGHSASAWWRSTG